MESLNKNIAKFAEPDAFGEFFIASNFYAANFFLRVENNCKYYCFKIIVNITILCYNK